MLESLNAFLAANPEVTYLAAMALLIPWVLAVVLKPSYSPTTKSVVAVGVCFVATAGWLVVHTWSTNQWVVYAVVLIGGTQLVYYAFKPGLQRLEEHGNT